MAAPGKFKRMRKKETDAANVEKLGLDGRTVMMWERENRTPKRVMVLYDSNPVKEGHNYRTVYERPNGDIVSTTLRKDNTFTSKNEARKEAVSYMKSLT